MDLEIICVSREVESKISKRRLRELHRDSIKTKTNPSLDLSRDDKVRLSTKKTCLRNNVVLVIDYSPPVNAIKVLEDTRNYEVLFKNITNSKLEWEVPEIQVANLNDEIYKKGKWCLTKAPKMYAKKLSEGKIVFSVGIQGISLDRGQKLKSEFDDISKCKGYQDLGVKDSIPMISSPIIYFTKFLDSLDTKQMKAKLSLLEQLGGSCWEVNDLYWHKDSIGLDKSTDLFSFKKVSPSLYRNSLLVPQGKIKEKEITAQYVFESTPDN